MSLAYDRAGAGEPVVLLHGVGSCRGVWQPVDAMLAAHHDVIAVDLPGFGDSPVDPQADGSVSGYADAVERLLASLEVGNPHVVGNSMGAAIAMELGNRGVARSVTAFSPIGFAGRAEMGWGWLTISGMRALAGFWRPLLPRFMALRPMRAALLGVFYGRPAQLSAERGVAEANALAAAPGVHPALSHIRKYRPRASAALQGIPMTVAWGTRDVVLPRRRQAGRAAVHLPWARHVALPGCGHLPFPDDPAACAAAVLATTKAV